ncbi:MAG: hypothetical protein K0Q53_107 [Massilibacillus sp.]|jgi:hypothetical protein|nr:hypothetical protein [Massilibacillus sp.]
MFDSLSLIYIIIAVVWYFSLKISYYFGKAKGYKDGHFDGTRNYYDFNHDE